MIDRTSTPEPLVLPKIELDVKDTCQALSCSRSHLNWLRKTGQLRATVRGRKVTFSYAELLDFAERGRAPR